MLVIRQKQLDAFSQSGMRQFEALLSAHLSSVWPREFSLVGDEPAQRQAVGRIIRCAQANGFETSRQLTLYAMLVVSLGIGFDTDPQFDWAATALRNAAIEDLTARIEAVFDQNVAYLGAVGGTDSEIVVKALLRVREFDFATAPVGEDEALVEDLCGLMGRFWPEKLAYQEISPTQLMIEQSIAKAREYGLESPPGICVFVTLGFFLGHAFDVDPLHPWARQALADPSADAPEARAAVLLRAGLRRLAQSLAQG